MSKSNKRDDILQAALELVAENGFHGAPMAMIADRAGVGAGTIYRYFADKDALMIAVYGVLEVKISELLAHGYSVEAPIRERFLHLGENLLRYLIDNPLEFSYLEQFHNSPYGTDYRRDKIFVNRDENNFFLALFEDGIAQNVIKDFPLPVLFDLAFGPTIAVARDHILGFVDVGNGLIEEIIEACWDGIRK